MLPEILHLGTSLRFHSEKRQDVDLHYNAPHKHGILQNVIRLKESLGRWLAVLAAIADSTLAISHGATTGQCLSAGTKGLPCLRVPSPPSSLQKVFCNVEDFLKEYLLDFSL